MIQPNLNKISSEHE